MNPITLHFASGDSLYTGILLLVAVMFIFYTARNRWLLRLRNLLAWSALFMILMACVPLGWWWHTLMILTFLFWFIIENRPASYARRPHLRDAASLAPIAILLIAFIHEWPRCQVQTVRGFSKTLCVLGDSISSGIEDGHPPWPDVYAKRYGVNVINLSRPGIGVAEARELADKIPGGEKIVLLEIGGNDILSGTPAADFERDLDAILQKSHRGTDALLMMELPLLPHMIEYGRIQRRLAAKHRVTLIPKRNFVQVISGGDATSDGLHLSPQGTEKMAELLNRVILWPPP